MNAIIRTRRDFLKQSMYAGAAFVAAGPLSGLSAQSSAGPGSKIKFGLVTYLWGRDWDLPTLIANCEKTKVPGVELRTEHAHGVESNLNAMQRREVKKRFDDSPVKLVGLGTNFAFHHTDSEKLRRDIEGAKEYVKLSQDVGGAGVKVKPNDLPEGVPQEKTIEQIGKSLNENCAPGSNTCVFLAVRHTKRQSESCKASKRPIPSNSPSPRSTQEQFFGKISCNCANNSR